MEILYYFDMKISDFLILFLSLTLYHRDNMHHYDATENNIKGNFMRALILPVVIGLIFGSTAGGYAQVNTTSETKVSDNPVVLAAYAVTSTPSGVVFRDKEFNQFSKKWFDGDLATANSVFASAPLKESSYSWRGRREGFLGNYAKAIEIFTEGLELFPESYALYRYRGFHLIRNYQFEEGIIDLRRAEALVESLDVTPSQKGIPGRSNFSPSTFKRNIYYYLAQSSMATGDYDTVIEYMDKAVEVNELSDQDDFLVSTSLYKYMAMRKLGQHKEAEDMIKAIPRTLNIISNQDYYEAVQFLQGRYTRNQFMGRADSIGLYTIGMVDYFNGNDDAAKKVFTTVTNDNHKGYWLAEVELLNLK